MFDKVTQTDINTNKVAAVNDILTGSPAENKAVFDKLALKITERFNALIDKLEATSAGLSGANNIGSAPINGVTGATIWAQIADLKAQLSNFALGAIADGSLTKAKFADFDGDVGDAILTDYEIASEGASISATDSLLTALGKLDKSISELDTSLTALSTDLASGDVVVAKATEAESATTISLDLIYPVGSIYISVNSTNPTAYWGGTWQSWGAGRVPVGVDKTQAEFDTIEETGGAKTHTLTASQMPSHNHTTTINTTTNMWGSIDMPGQDRTEKISITNPTGATRLSLTTGVKTWNAGHAEGSISDKINLHFDHTHTASSASVGDNSAHNNLQPYITCYMWKRTA